MVKSILPVVLLLLSACSALEFPGVYRIEVEQGNILTQEQVNQLKPGMTREQVRFLLGSPIIQDTFNQNRWDYVYHLVKQDRSREQKHLSLEFKDDRLTTISGTIVPDTASAQSNS